MKSQVLITLMTALAVSAHAARNEPLKAMPKEAFGVYSMEDAKKQAAKKKDPIVFLYVNERSEDAKVDEAAKIAYWGLEKDATVVVLRPNSAGAWKTRLPENLVAAMNSKEIGKEYPRIVVMDQSASVVLTSVTATALIDGGEDYVKGLSKQIKELNKTPPKADAPPAAAPGPATTPATSMPAPAATTAAVVMIKDGKVESWTNAQGVAIQATLLEVASDKVVFLMGNGTKVDYPLASLSDASKKRVEELKNAP